MEAILESIGYLCQETFGEFAFTMMTLPIFMLYKKSNKKRPRKFNPQGKKWFRGECSQRETVMTSGSVPCSSVQQMWVSKENSFSWGPQSKEGSRVGEGNSSRVTQLWWTHSIKFWSKVLKQLWGAESPAILCHSPPILSTVTWVTMTGLMPSSCTKAWLFQFIKSTR